MSEERKVSRRGWIKYAGAGVVVVAAAAAGAGYYATQPTPKPTTPTPTPTTPTPTPTTTPTAKVLKVWQLSYASETDRVKWENLYAKFTKETGIKVEASNFGGDDIVSKCTNIFESKAVENFPDLISPAWSLNPVWSVRGYLEPLDDVMDWLKSNYGNDIIPILPKSVYWMGSKGERRYYAIPTGVVVGAMFWRGDILQKVGIDTNDLVEFETYDKALYKIKSKIKDLGILAPLSAQTSATGSTDCTNGFYWVFRAFSGVYPIDPETLKIQLDDTPEHFQAVVKTVETYARWYKDGINIQSALVDAGVDNNLQFINGQVATTFNGIASIYAVLKDRKAPFLDSTITLPCPGNSQKNVKPEAVIDPRFMMIPAGLPKERAELAKTFIKFFLKKENYMEWFGTSGGFGWYDCPIYLSMANAEPYTSHPIWRAVKDTVLGGGFPPIDLWRPSFGTLRPAPPTIEIGGYILGKYASAEDAAKAIVDRIKKLAKQYDTGLP
ncbi:MAG: ABC transporter substrate-binding protein [Candidatus Bathyarchaeia archaeon]